MYTTTQYPRFFVFLFLFEHCVGVSLLFLWLWSGGVLAEKGESENGMQK